MHQFLAADDGRGVAGADEDTVDTNADDDGAQDEVDKSAAEAEDNDFDSEDTPDDDSFLQTGSKTHSPWDGDDDDASDYSMHQFLAADDGRGVAGADEDTVDTN